MTEKPFKLDDFDSEVEMWELLNTQREVIIDLEGKVNALHEENQELRELLKIGETNAKDIINVLNIQEQYKVKANELEKENIELKEAMKRMMSDMMGGMR